MVLPWVNGTNTPAFRDGLLGSCYYDCEQMRMHFAVDQRMSLRLVQSPFYQLKGAATSFAADSRNYVSALNHRGVIEEHIEHLRETKPGLGVSDELLTAVLREDLSLAVQEQNLLPGGRNRLQILSPPDLNGHHILLRGGADNCLAVDAVTELDIDDSQAFLSRTRLQRFRFRTPVEEVRTNGAGWAVAGANMCAGAFEWREGRLEQAFAYQTHDDSIRALDVHRAGGEMAVLLQRARRLVIQRPENTREIALSETWTRCNYHVHPSLVVLSGETSRIELMDLRGAFPGLHVADRILPFVRVDALATHLEDPNLLAIGCRMSAPRPSKRKGSEGHTSPSPASASAEMRIYDIRYPREATMRIALERPLQNLSFGRFMNLGERHDEVLGVDTLGHGWHWALEHSKCNVTHSDGVLTLTDTSFLGRPSTEPLGRFVAKKTLGLTAFPTARGPSGCCIVRQLNTDVVEYAYLAKGGSQAAFLSEDMIGPVNLEKDAEWCDMSHLAEEDVQSRNVDAELATFSIVPLDHGDFSPIGGPSRLLDLQWDAAKRQVAAQRERAKTDA